MIRLDVGAFTQLVKFLGTKVPCKSGLGIALEPDIMLLPYMVSEIQAQGKFSYKYL